MLAKILAIVKKKFKNLKPIHAVYLVVPLLLWWTVPLFSKLYEYIRNFSNSVGSTITTEQAKLKVTQLKEAFTNLLDNYDDIAVILSGVSTSNYYKIKLEFGMVYRSYATGGVGTGIQANSVMSELLDLTSWLSKELEPTQLTDLRTLNPNLPI
jgi:hypothetical protein